MKFLSSRKAAVIVSALIFVFLFVLNCLTPYHVDDFVYHFRFDNSEPLEHIADIIPSMAAHAQLFNGRLVVHSLVQLFELLPKPVFNIVNAGMFVLLILLMERFIFFGQTGSALHILLIFCAVFVLMPVFGEVCLWLDGSINYLWAIIFNLLFIYPYFRLFSNGEKFTAPPAKLAFIAFAFVCGALQETMSSASFLLSVVFLLLTRFYAKRRVTWEYIAAAVFSFAGLIFMATRPAEIDVKSAAVNIINLFISFVNMMKYFRSFAPLIAVFIVSFILCCARHADTKQLILASVFFLGFLCANSVMLLAKIYPERCAAPATVYIILADALLLTELARSGYALVMRCAAALLCTVCVYCAVLGSADLLSTYAQFKANENTIAEARSCGETEVSLPMLYGATKYSVAYHMACPSSIDWVNSYIARYYGVERITGYDFYSQYFSYTEN